MTRGSCQRAGASCGWEPWPSYYATAGHAWEACQRATKLVFGSLLCSLETLRVLRCRFVWQGESVGACKDAAERIFLLTALGCVVFTGCFVLVFFPGTLGQISVMRCAVGRMFTVGRT